MKRLEIIEYPPGVPFVTRNIPDPAWDVIQAAVLQLDRHRFPFVNLCGTYDESDDDYLTIMGGTGLFWLALTAGAHDQTRLFDADCGNHEVELWTSDQGFGSPECYTTNDINIIFTAARYFCEHGSCDPSLAWDTVA